MRVCTFEGCDRKYSSIGYCTTHAYQKRSGKIMQPIKDGRGLGYLDKSGYRIVYNPIHPNSWKSGYVAEHVMVMSDHLGRPLFKGEQVHHRDGVRHHNNIENLELWVVSQPAGQRPEDLVAWAKTILERYDN